MRKQRTSLSRGVGRPPTSDTTDRDTRAAILNAARRIFAQNGIDGTSVREVAERAGVNNAMIYYHFKDKVDLYRAVLADSFAALDRMWEHEIFTSAASARLKIQKYVEELIRFQEGNEDLRKIISMELANCGENCKWIAENYFQHHYRKLLAILEQGMRSGELKKLDPTYAISTLVGMIIHTFISRPVSEYVIGKQVNLSNARFGKFVTTLFFDGLGSPQNMKKHVRGKLP